MGLKDPNHSARGYRADDWDLSNPFATAELTVKQRGDDCTIYFYKHQQGGAMRQLLAECPLEFNEDPKHKAHNATFFVEAVQDSSRYFVVRIKDKKSGRIASLGIGFRNREDAFSFRAGVEDFFKQRKRDVEDKRAPEVLTPVLSRAAPLGSAGKIKLKINVKKKDANTSQAADHMNPLNAGMETVAVSETIVAEDEWGDFQ